MCDNGDSAVQGDGMGFLESLRDRELRGLYRARKLIEGADLRLAQGQAEGVQADLDKAKDILFADLQRKSPHARDFADALVALARAQLRAGRPDDALKAADKALTLQEHYPPATVVRATVLTSKGAYPEAQALLEQAIELRPSDKSLHLEKARVLEAAGRSADAVLALKRAAEIDPSDMEVLEQLIAKDDRYQWTLRKAELFLGAKRYDEAVEALDAVAAQGQGNTDVLLVKGRILLEAARWDEAMAVYDAVLAIDPASYGGNLGRAQALKGRGELEASVRYYKEALRADVERRETWLEVGTVLEKLDRMEEAEKVYAKALALEPRDLAAAEGHLRTLTAQAKWPEAADAAKLVVSIRPDLPAFKAQVSALLKAGRPKEAMDAVAFALSRFPRESDLMSMRRDATVALGLSDDTVKECEALLAQRPGDGETMYALGAAYNKAMRFSEAVKVLEKALKVHPDKLAVLLALKEAYKGQGKDKDVLATGERIIELDPKHAATMVDMGVALTRLGRKEEAIKTYQDVLALEPGNQDALRDLALVLCSMGRHEEALTKAVAGCQLFPEDPSFWRVKGDALYAQERYAEAAEALAKAISLDPANRLLWWTRGLALVADRRPEEAVVSYEQALKLDPNDFNIWISRGEALAGLSRHSSAIQSFEKAIELDPDNRQAHLLRGMSLLKVEMYAEAVNAFDRALALGQKDVAVLEAKKEALKALGRNEDVVAVADHILRLDPKNKAAFMDKAAALKELGRNDDAIRAYDRVLAVDPRDREVLERKKEALIAKGDHEGVIGLCDLLLQIDPLSKTAHADRGDALSALNQVEEAVAEYEHAVKADPTDRAVLNKLGLALMRLERYPQAAQAFDQGWRLDPADLVMLDNKGRALLMGGDSSGALEAFNRAVEADPDNPTFMMDRGRALASQGNYEDALRALDRALELDGNDGQAWKYRGNVLFKMGDKVGAAESYSRAVGLGAGTAMVWRSKGRAEEETGHLEAALESYVHAAKLEEDAFLWMRIGIVQARMDLLEDAVRSLDRSIYLDSTNDRAWLNRAAILEKLGEDEEALRCFDTVLAHAPHDKYAWSGKGRVLMRMDKLDQAKRAVDKALELDPELASAKETDAALTARLKEREISIYAGKVLEFEYRQNRRVTREEAFKECGLPFAALDEVTTFLQTKEAIDVEALDDASFQAYEILSRDILLATLGNPNYARQGLHLAEVYMHMPERDVRKAKKVLAYIEAVNRMDFPPERPDKSTERLLRAAVALPQSAHSTLGVMEHLDLGLYTARKVVSMLSTFGEPAAPRSAPAPLPEPEVTVEAPAGRPEAVEERPARPKPSTQRKEAREMSFFRNRKGAEEEPRPVDRSCAVTVKYYPNTEQYNRRNCIFHGELAVTVCPNCGTLFCMDCTRFEACPRCRTPLIFVDGTKDLEAVDDSDVIETEAQRRAIQQRWAQKRLAEAERGKVRERDRRALMSDRDVMSEKALKIAEKVMRPPEPAEPTAQTFQSAAPAPAEPRPVARPPAGGKKRGANSLVAAALAYQPPAAEDAEAVPAPQPAAEPAVPEPEPAPPQPEEAEDPKKAERERLKALLEAPEEEEGSTTRDLTRL